MEFRATPLLQVFLQWEEEKIPVGRLAIQKGQIYFQYQDSFLEQALPLSPFRLPLTQELFSGEPHLFEGLHGLFNDSLPDGWGRLLLDRSLLSKGIAYQQLTPLDRLAFVGSSAMGALTYEPETATEPPDDQVIHLDQLARDVTAILEGSSGEVVTRLLTMGGGSSAGARPKILASYNHGSDQLLTGTQQVPTGYEPWLIKFASTTDQPDIGNIEYAYSKMAQAAGIETSETRLFTGQGKRQYFGTRRFDRIGNRRLHMHSASGLLGADHRFPSLDYDNLMRATLALCKDHRELTKVYRLMCFNVFAHNRDDHSKNFAFLMAETGTWSFAPAYDLTFSYGPGGEHSAALLGEGRNPGTPQLLKMASKFGIQQPKNIIEEVRTTVDQWPAFAQAANVSEASILSIRNTLNKIS